MIDLVAEMEDFLGTITATAKEKEYMLEVWLIMRQKDMQEYKCVVIKNKNVID